MIRFNLTEFLVNSVYYSVLLFNFIHNHSADHLFCIPYYLIFTPIFNFFFYQKSNQINKNFKLTIQLFLLWFLLIIGLGFLKTLYPSRRSVVDTLGGAFINFFSFYVICSTLTFFIWHYNKNNIDVIFNSKSLSSCKYVFLIGILVLLCDIPLVFFFEKIPRDLFKFVGGIAVISHIFALFKGILGAYVSIKQKQHPINFLGIFLNLPPIIFFSNMLIFH